GCNMQFGGNDQWSNMLGGTELIRKKLGEDAFAMTIELLTDSHGNKMGKTAGNAVWLDADKTSPFDFFQYWRNVDDADVIKCMKMLTFMPLEEIAEYEGLEGSSLNAAKEKLAYELTLLVHGRDEAERALDAAKSVFGGAGAAENMPSTELSDDDFNEGGIGLLDLLIKTKLAPSRREGRTLVTQGGILIDGERVTDSALTVEKERFADGVIIKKGKKTYHKVKLK
ncbi:MAG: tyrosine--tRNA ligase, partial [Firmicutes bacterium]|nr:tyrosine--tRNA ligase [Bacillota bacterium]